MHKYVTVSQMIDIEKAADRAGHTYSMMMEAAGKGLAESIINAYSQIGKKRVVALVGKGNNGSDALVALKYLIKAGWSAECILAADIGDNELLDTVIELGCKLVVFSEDDPNKFLYTLLKGADVVIDGLLGTGMKLPVREPFTGLLGAVKNQLNNLENRPKIVAVDCPSGVDCNTGKVSPCTLKADLTACMAAYKSGMLKFPANEYLGDVEIIDIGLPKDLEEWQGIKRYVPNKEDIRKLIPIRSNKSHKGTFGTLLVVAGSVSYSGAAWLSGNAAYRSGVGMVTLAVPESIYPILAKDFPEATWIVLPEKDGFFSEAGAEKLLRQLGRTTALLIGPGFGTSDCSGEFIKEVVKNIDSIPIIVDADGLRLLSNIENWYEILPNNSILTPHPGEMSELTGISNVDIQEDRVNIAEKYAKKWGHVVILKGAFTVLASPSGESVIMPFASSALATAGTGDVLAGLVAGFVAQGMKPFQAAYFGVWIHAQAGIEAAKVVGSSAGVIAGDLIPQIPKLLNK